MGKLLSDEDGDTIWNDPVEDDFATPQYNTATGARGNPDTISDHQPQDNKGSDEQAGELKKALKKDFNQLLVKEFTSDWSIQRLKIGLDIDVMSLDNLQALITSQAEAICEEVIAKKLDVSEWGLRGKLDYFDDFNAEDAVYGYNLAIKDTQKKLSELLHKRNGE